MTTLTYGPSRRVLTQCPSGQCPPGPSVMVPTLCPGYIVGVVYDLGTHNVSFGITHPLPDVGLWVESFETGSYAQAVSDEFGRFRLGPLEPGEGYFLAAKRECYSRRILEDGVMPPQGLLQSIGLVRTGCVRGVVYGPQDERVTGAQVYLSQQDDPTWGGGEVVTDGSGEFRICTLDAATGNSTEGSNYSLLVVHPEYSNTSTGSSAFDIVFVPPRYVETDIVEIEVALQERAMIQGFVTSGGLPLAGANVYIAENMSGLLIDEEGTVTDASGYFSMSVSAPANYHIVLKGNGTETANLEVSVAPNAVIQVSRELAGAGSIFGTVTDLSSSPVVAATIEVLSKGNAGSIVNPVNTDENGSYTIVGLAPDKVYTVNAVMPEAEILTGFPSILDVSVTPGNTTVVNLQGDTVAPMCQINSPLSGANLSGNVNVVADASDNQSVGMAVIEVDGEDVSSVAVGDPASGLFIQQATVTFEWDSTSVSNGNHTIVIHVYDVVGNRVSSSVNVMINN